jgi:hypothetical protein
MTTRVKTILFRRSGTLNMFFRLRNIAAPRVPDCPTVKADLIGW